MVEWHKIRAEYISSKTSYRKLAEKHGVSFNTLKDIAVAEKWFEQRQQNHNTTTTEIINEINKKTVSNTVSIISAADTVLDKTMGLINSLEVTDIDTLKSAATILKILKEVKDVKSEADQQEQMARIAKLRKEAEDDTPEDRKVNVTFIGDVEEYSK